jgi:hypothetical protein
MRREAARLKLETGLRKLEAKQTVSSSEEKAILYLANHFIWRPAFTDDELLADFRHVTINNGIIGEEDGEQISEIKSMLTLFAISRLHGASIKIEDGITANLMAGFANRERRLEVKLDLGYKDWTKPVYAPICIFLTSLQPESHCDPVLIDASDPPIWDAWSYPIELGADGRLKAIT